MSDALGPWVIIFVLLIPPIAVVVVGVLLIQAWIDALEGGQAAMPIEDEDFVPAPIQYRVGDKVLDCDANGRPRILRHVDDRHPVL